MASSNAHPSSTTSSTNPKALDALVKALDKATDMVTEDLMEVSYMRKDIKAAMGGKCHVDEATCGEIREKALGKFKHWVHQQMGKVIAEEKIDHKLRELDELHRVTPKDTEGWRPSDDPWKDTYVVRRPAYVDYVEKLKEIKRGLEGEIAVEEAALAEEEAYISRAVADCKLHDHQLGS